MISYYELLGMIKEGNIPNKIKVHLTPVSSRDYISEYDIDGSFSYYRLENEKEENDDYRFCLCDCYLETTALDETIEILDEEKELHANEIVFNCDKNKRECVITLDENDLGIDKLHIDNCYFYKANDKWYIRKYDFKTFNIEDEKKIGKIHWKPKESLEEKFNSKEKQDILARRTERLKKSINEIIDILNKEE